MICIAAALAILHLQNLALGFSHSDPDPFGACHPRDSCFPFRNEDEDHLWGNYTCECGRHCVRYGTCCGDSPHAGTTPLLRVEHHHPGEKCRRLPPYFAEYFTSVSSCSDRWRHESLARDACEKGHDDASAEDPLSAIPVTSEATGVTYKNHFCATCNFEDALELRMWDAVLLLHEAKEDSDFLNATKDYVLDKLLYDRERRSWGVSTDDHSFLKLRLLFRVPPVLRKVVKKCHPAIVSDCDASHHGLRYGCLSYYSPVTMMKSNDGRRAVKRYRNVHCAICNGVPSTDEFACGADVQRRKKPTFSFAHLIDISGDSAGRGGDRCGGNQVWDPFSKKCRSLACALPGYVIKDGKCVKS